MFKYFLISRIINFSTATLLKYTAITKSVVVKYDIQVNEWVYCY